MSGSPGASERLFERAQRVIPGGVSSPVRAFKSVGGTPRYMTRGVGGHVFDEDGREYVDFCMAWGPLILGHANAKVIEAVTTAARDGLAFGTVHRHEPRLAELILSAFTWAERVRFVVSGTEAVMTAIRLARSHTGRKRLLKFTGCYHGHGDSMLVKAGSGVVTLGLAESEGVANAQDTLVVPLGDVEALEQAFREHGDTLAAALIEPLPANNGLLLQASEFLQKLRALTKQHGVQLIFDEVINGFRFGFHGYGKLVGVEPDLTTLGKIVGGGLPVGAVIGRAAILDRLAPLGKTYQAGTMAGNPVALAAGIATLEQLETGAPYRTLDALGAQLDALVAKKRAPAFRLVRVGSVFWPYYELQGALPNQAEKVSDAHIAGFKQRYGGWLEHGLYLPPSAWEVGFLSAAHTPEDLERLVAAL